MVIDSHVLLWWLEERPELSPRAGTLLDQAESGSEVFYVCAVSFWELRLKERRGLLRPRRPINDWPGLLNTLPWLRIEPTSASSWLLSANLEWSHRDPADRILAATALQYGLPILTKDQVFHQPESPVEAIW